MWIATAATGMSHRLNGAHAAGDATVARSGASSQVYRANMNASPVPHAPHQQRSSRRRADARIRAASHREAALAWLDAQVHPLAAELVPLRIAAGRVLAASVVSDVDVPGFDRATMDGYAVVADSTEGATAYSPLPLTVIGDSMPGCPLTVWSPPARRFAS